MRLTLHWRGKPLLAVDLTANSPDDGSQPPTSGIEASDGGEFERAEPVTAPDITTRIGFTR